MSRGSAVWGGLGLAASSWMSGTVLWCLASRLAVVLSNRI